MPNAALSTTGGTIPQYWRGLCCPACRGALHDGGNAFACLSCGKPYPSLNGAPALLDSEQSLFDPGPVQPARQTNRWSALLPSLSANPVSSRNYARVVEELLLRSAAPRALVVGGGRAGQGMDAALAHPRIDWIETDVAPGRRTEMLCDAQQIPFEDKTFDAVVAQAVLEHVADPERAVAEIWRVLKPGGLVYAETPFLQQVHAGAYDFTRYTHLGHRRLFRRFTEIDSGAACGPGMALAWAWRGFLQSWFTSPAARTAATVAAHLTAFWLKAFDSFLVTRPAAFDCASSYYFFGEKSALEATDRELVAGYRGLQRS
jgi:SAM-dependent methyltransferase